MEFVELNEIGSGEFGSVFKCLNRLGTVTAVYFCIMYFNQPFPSYTRNANFVILFCLTPDLPREDFTLPIF